MRVALLALVFLAGCLDCQPLLEVRHCLERQCDPSPDAVEVAWTEEDAQTWPDVDRLMDRTELGEHEHRKWTHEREQAFWQQYGVTGDRRELIAEKDDELYRVRVLTCD